MRSDWLDRCLHMRNELSATSQNYPPPWGRVSSCLQCNTSTQNNVCCGHSPGKSPLSSYLRCARTGGTGALSCRVAAFVSHFPRVKSCCVALVTRRTACSAGSSWVFAAIASVLRECRREGGGWSFSPRLHRTNGDDEEAADKRRAGAAAQRCRLLASPLEAEGREGWSLRTLFLHIKTVVILRNNMPSK